MIAMLLGLEPMPERTAPNGRIHIPEGSGSTRPPATRPDRMDAITRRRASIVRLCSNEECSVSDLSNELQIPAATLMKDLDILVLARELSVTKTQGRKNLYWVQK